MPFAGSGFLAIWNDFDSSREAEYECWHTFEHVPERVGVPGFVSARRYCARERSDDRYFTLYDVERVDVFESAGYADLVENPTEWSMAMRPLFRNFARLPCTTIASRGLGLGGSVATVVMELPKPFGQTDATKAAADRVARDLLEKNGITSVHVGIEIPGKPYPLGVVGEVLPTDTVRSVLVLEGTQRRCLEDAKSMVCDVVESRFRPKSLSRWASYDIAFSVCQAELPIQTSERQPQRKDLRSQFKAEPLGG